MVTKYRETYDYECVYHICNRSSHNSDTFVYKEDFQDYLDKYNYYLGCCFQTIAYCLMSNHFHFLVRVLPHTTIKAKLKNHATTKAMLKFTENKLSVDKLIRDQYRRLHSSYVTKFNLKHSRRGQLFLKTQKNILVNNDNYCRTLICYIHHNPIHHGVFRYYHQWDYSSYRAYLSAEESNVARHIGFELFEDSQDFLNAHKRFEYAKLEYED